ncbi:MAG: DUF1569 domain-containing protein [Gemmatimonas sp.]
MLIRNIFDPAVADEVIGRINRLTPATTPAWGKMTVDQMLAHLNVMYVMVYETTIPRPNAFMRLILRTFVKNAVVGPKPYPRSTPTAPAFRMTGMKDFAAEKARLVAYMQRVARDGKAAFEGRESHSFGPLTASEWNVLFYKHLDHHLTQFGV